MSLCHSYVYFRCHFMRDKERQREDMRIAIVWVGRRRNWLSLSWLLGWSWRLLLSPNGNLVLWILSQTQAHLPGVARFAFPHLVLFQWRLCARQTRLREGMQGIGMVRYLRCDNSSLNSNATACVFPGLRCNFFSNATTMICRIIFISALTFRCHCFGSHGYSFNHRKFKS